MTAIIVNKSLNELFLSNRRQDSQTYEVVRDTILITIT